MNTKNFFIIFSISKVLKVFPLNKNDTFSYETTMGNYYMIVGLLHYYYLQFYLPAHSTKNSVIWFPSKLFIVIIVRIEATTFFYCSSYIYILIPKARFLIFDNFSSAFPVNTTLGWSSLVIYDVVSFTLSSLYVLLWLRYSI